MNIDYCHHDTKTLNENYLKVIEGSSMYYEWYVKQLRQELQRKDDIINELKKWLEIKEEKETIGTFSDVLDKIKELENDN